ncbi:hypothetical protein NC653_023111 [Populus alba x Populus x berolinensis]|uniref:Uncharacterized protein n=1 Tax=Populus alba x Populus x berolinensis TaxID=444605 RepID=A0AAD6QAG3_9ROSI|nr:hypothetical protein NC653_023111 [Populus alba x Populus x berolinensis]
MAVEAINGGLLARVPLESSCDRCRYQAHLRSCQLLWVFIMCLE